MNVRRIELEKSLPPPPKDLGEFLWRAKNDCQLNINDQDLVFMVRLMGDYLRSPGGRQLMLKALNSEVKPASSLHSYFKAGFLNDETQRIQPSDLVHYSGWIYKQQFGCPQSAIEVDEREDSVICDSCGGKFPGNYCTRNVEVLKNTGRTILETWCNHCRSNSENPRVRESGSPNTCGNCEKKECDFHPKHVETFMNMPTRSPIAGLLPPAQSMILPPGWENPL